MESQRPLGSHLNQLADLIPVSWPSLDEGKNQQFCAAFFQFSFGDLNLLILHNNILNKNCLQLVKSLSGAIAPAIAPGAIWVEDRDTTLIKKAENVVVSCVDLELCLNAHHKVNLLFVPIFTGHIVLGHFVGANFFFIGAVGVFHTHYCVGFEGISFLEQFTDAL